MRGDKHWTPANETCHWAWMAYDHAKALHEATLRDDDPYHDLWEHQKVDAVCAAFPNGWPRHPDDPTR